MCELWSSRERGEEQWEEKLQRGRQRDRERVATHPRAPSVEDGGSGADESREQERGARIHVVCAIEPPGNSVHAGIADSSDSRRAFAGPTGGVEARLDNQGVAVTIASPFHHSAAPQRAEDAAEEAWLWVVAALALGLKTADGKLRVNPRVGCRPRVRRSGRRRLRC